MNKELKYILLIVCCLVFMTGYSQSNHDSTIVYKKRVLESIEIDFLSSYYTQSGDNASVSGGIGTEELDDVTGTVVVSIPINADDVLTIDAGISAYTSASSSNVNPFDRGVADPFQASSGASKGDVWSNLNIYYSHSSDDRNSIWSGKVSVSSEYDYFSVGFGGGYSRLFNDKNTELSVNVNVFLDTWDAIYPYELRPFRNNRNGLNNRLFTQNTITGNANYSPIFNTFRDENRNSYALGLGFSQILHRNVQSSFSVDFVQQEGLLSTPFQRVYFADVADSFIEDFQLADANELLPSTRFKVALGGRINWFLNETFTVRTFYRYYFDDWGINSHTASIEIPIKISDKFTLYPSYRFYNQRAADYFYPHETAVSTSEFYTSDYDLSQYSANQFGFGISYTDIFTKAHIWKIGLKSIDVKFYLYNRNTTFKSNIVTAGLKFVIE